MIRNQSPINRWFMAISLLLFSLLLLAACQGENRPRLPDIAGELPDLSQIPGLPSEWGEVPDLLSELELPDFSQINIELPELDDLPTLRAEPGTALFRGPYEYNIGLGEQIPGTNIVLVSVAGTEAEFQIDGLRSLRISGDSLQFDGPWPGLGDSTYNLRLRIYRISDNGVRAAGVHQLLIQNVNPVTADINESAEAMRFPVAGSTNTGEMIIGTSFGYGGEADDGAQLTGLPAGDYPYFNIGDSIRWRGVLRPDLPVRYNMRVIYYNANSIEIGGVAHVYLPGL